MHPSFYFCVILLVSIASAASGLNINYVKPDSSASSPPRQCPGQPCLTLTQYMNTNIQTIGSVFVFLGGNHSLESPVRLYDGSNITFMAESKSPIVNINCGNRVDISVTNIINFSIIGLRFFYNSSNMNTFLTFVDSGNVRIKASQFYGNKKQYSVLAAINSTLTVEDCIFYQNAGGLQGAIFTVRSKINLTNNFFFKNEAVYGGGALYASNSSVILVRNNFHRNRAKVEGGAIYADSCDIRMDNNSFFRNQAAVTGGAISLSNCRITLYSNLFFGNRANVRGGAIGANTSNISIRFNDFINNSALKRGGALYLTKSRVELDRNNFVDNRALFWDDIFGNASILYHSKGNSFGDINRSSGRKTTACINCFISMSPEDDFATILAVQPKRPSPSVSKALQMARLASLLLQVKASQ